jgi:hypothetical protein
MGCIYSTVEVSVACFMNIENKLHEDERVASVETCRKMLSECVA